MHISIGVTLGMGKTVGTQAEESTFAEGSSRDLCSGGVNLCPRTRRLLTRMATLMPNPHAGRSTWDKV